MNPAAMPVLLAAAGIIAAQAIMDGHAQAVALRKQHDADRGSRDKEQQSALTESQAIAEADVVRAEQRLTDLLALASSFGISESVRAVAPNRQGDDVVSMFAYVAGLTAFAHQIEVILLNETARLDRDVIAETPSIDVARTSEQYHLASRIGERLLQRIAHLGKPPQHISSLAQELDEAPPGDRASMLASELRLQIQRYVGLVHDKMVEEATATVVQQSLRDLGYVVEDIPNTLFVEGGVVHFKRRDWGDYMVRMRISENHVSANFNVVRGVEGGVAEPSVMDHIAEDRWCSEFPSLLKAFEARGIGMQVTRHLAAGELPVQVVDKNILPSFSTEDDGQETLSLRARVLK